MIRCYLGEMSTHNDANADNYDIRRTIHDYIGSLPFMPNESKSGLNWKLSDEYKIFHLSYCQADINNYKTECLKIMIPNLFAECSI